MTETYKQKHPNFGKSDFEIKIKNNISILSDQRKEQSDKIRTQYPDRIPIICEKSTSSKLPDIDKNK